MSTDHSQQKTSSVTNGKIRTSKKTSYKLKHTSHMLSLSITESRERERVDLYGDEIRH